MKFRNGAAVSIKVPPQKVIHDHVTTYTGDTRATAYVLAVANRQKPWARRYLRENHCFASIKGAES